MKTFIVYLERALLMYIGLWTVFFQEDAWTIISYMALGLLIGHLWPELPTKETDEVSNSKNIHD